MLMNISQHSFCPLGFIDGHYYDDYKKLQVNANFMCSSLSPSFGSNFVSFIPRTFRFWSPLFKESSQVVPSFVSGINLVDDFLYSVSSSVHSFLVLYFNY